MKIGDKVKARCINPKHGGLQVHTIDGPQDDPEFPIWVIWMTCSCDFSRVLFADKSKPFSKLKPGDMRESM